MEFTEYRIDLSEIRDINVRVFDQTFFDILFSLLMVVLVVFVFVILSAIYYGCKYIHLEKEKNELSYKEMPDEPVATTGQTLI